MSKIIEIPIQTQKLLKISQTIVPLLSATKHKGQCGRIGVVGGSLEYTGAPYFAAFSALKVGADISHVFCQGNAASTIKSYSPELIVHPLLDAENAIYEFQKWLDRLHVVIVGPGLGLEPRIQNVAVNIIKQCLDSGKPMVIDADGLTILNNNFDLVCGHRNIILTPNAIEFRRIFGDDIAVMRERMTRLGDGVIVLEKGANDKIHIPHTEEVYTMPIGGSGRRCGGQGDILSGALATFFYWSLESCQPNPAFIASFAASYLVKQCNSTAFQKSGRSMLASDMVNEISTVFQNFFENSINKTN